VKFRSGCTRDVLLIGGWAIKVPNITLRSWRLFLIGLLCNINEVAWSRAESERMRGGHPSSVPCLAPVLFALPGGFLLVMKRCDPVDPAKFYDQDRARFKGIPCEDKPCSFGLLGGNMVVLDYGDDVWSPQV
jgi:hypothetical protein